MKALAQLWIYRLYVRNKKSRFNSSIPWILSSQGISQAQKQKARFWGNGAMEQI